MRHLPVISLIGSNFIPIIGVLFYGWSIPTILFLYWVESGVIGFFNIFKMLLAQGSDSEIVRLKDAAFFEKYGKYVMIPFFMIHYSGFMLGHWAFIYGIFGSTIQSNRNFLLTLLVMFISHEISFIVNFIGRQEYLSISTQAQMVQPYKRIVVMHLTIIFGSWLSIALKAPVGAVLIMIGIKTFLDLQAHLKEHRSYGTLSTSPILMDDIKQFS